MARTRELWIFGISLFLYFPLILSQIRQVSDEELGAAFILNSYIYLAGDISAQSRQGETQVLFRADNTRLGTHFAIYVQFQPPQAVIKLRSRDRRDYQVTFPSPVLANNDELKIMVYFGDLQRASNEIRVYVNCEAIGRDNTEIPIREGILGEVRTEKSPNFQFYVNANVRNMLRAQGCSIPDEVVDTSTEPTVLEVPQWAQSTFRERPSIHDSRSGRMDGINIDLSNRFPDYDVRHFRSLESSLRGLTHAVRQLQIDLQSQTVETRSLREELRSCDMCRLGSHYRRPQQLTTCASNPCFRGVRCEDTPRGYRCGACPRGYRGDGASCTRLPTCRDRPCFQGVTCYDIGNGYRCGQCPSGLTGDGTRDGCRPFRPSCDNSPCFPGVLCSDTAEGYTCGPCPEGYNGNGTQCQDINE
ncbi:hypothetical protein KUTeg_017932 [Tegillarca granosa]|uniref:EGF-like domain-containing protein n=1 Tax=Tegillarca granosa TaxID=220873 RepID=A0ABQ9EHW9_TEGGR|nr:hypothetical protein KUTeg_017932 [Tegillarca granosa]